VSDYHVGDLLDDLAGKILASPDRGAGLRRLRVHPGIYDVIASAKSRELDRGNPLLLLGMDLVRADGVAPNRPEAS
jgi:hypothetical protein